MLEHIGFRVSDLEKSKVFFVAALKPLGIELVVQGRGWMGFGRNGPPQFLFEQVAEQQDKLVPIHICFSANSREDVDAFYAAAVASGAKDNGKPGVREMYHASYYAAYVIDRDGNNIEAVYQG